MADKLYAEHRDGGTYILSFDIERDAIIAHMTVEEYINDIKELNPQFTKVYTLNEI